MHFSSRIGSIGTALGFLGVVLGALGAHALEQILEVEALESFKTGVYYLQWHGLVLVVIGFATRQEERISGYLRWSIGLFGLGMLLFSGSIFGLVLLPLLDLNVRFLGPVTPIGGLSLMAGWVALLLHFIRPQKNK
jgi:uncharacterized membrane protein YgdD (TMEM256/DUF423 family)